MTLRLRAPLLLMWCVFFALPATAQVTPLRTAPSGEEMMDRSCRVGAGHRLAGEVPDADVVITSGEAGMAHVRIYLDGRDMDRAREYYEDLRFEASQDGETVRVEADAPNWRGFRWDRDGDAHIQVFITLPRTFEVDVQTSDGDVGLDALDGRATLRTSDGDVVVGRIDGPALTVRTSDGDVDVERAAVDEASLQTSDGDITVGSLRARDVLLRTSDGDVRAENLEGRVEASTSDGDLRVGRADGPSIRLRTSDGTVTADALRADRIEVHSSDGDLRLGRVDGALRATSSGGDITVALARPAEAYLRTSDGDIDIATPANFAADLRLRGDAIRIARAFDFRGTLDDEHADGRLGSGGALVEAHASDGTVTLRDQ